MSHLRLIVLIVPLAVAIGCGGKEFVPVSGVVKVDGKPFPKAVVSFQPVGSKDSPNPGRGSSAYTDDNGKFVLKCDGEIDGAIVGKHLVRIMSAGNNVVGQYPEGSSPDGAPANRQIDPIPPEWNALSDKTFDVPAGGTDQANFDITSKRGK